MVSKKKLATTAVATFGVAMTSMYVAPEMQADVLDLTYNGGAASATNPFVAGSTGNPLTIAFDQVSSNAWVQWNDQLGGTGRTQAFFTNSTIGPESVDVVSAGAVIDPNTFVGRTTLSSLGYVVPAALGGGTEFDGTGSAFIACRPRADQANLMWFKIEFTQGGPIVYSDGQYGNAGEALTVGGGGKKFEPGDVNCDGAVDLLDVNPFVAAILNAVYDIKADVNEDGSDDLLDVQPLVDKILGL